MINKSTKLTLEQWDRKVTLEIPHSDTDTSELLDLFKCAALALGYGESAWEYAIIESAEEISNDSKFTDEKNDNVKFYNDYKSEID